jgi:hypothetical protein
MTAGHAEPGRLHCFQRVIDGERAWLLSQGKLFLLFLVPALAADLLTDDFLRCAMTFFPMICDYQSIILETKR